MVSAAVAAAVAVAWYRRQWHCNGAAAVAVAWYRQQWQRQWQWHGIGGSGSGSGSGIGGSGSGIGGSGSGMASAAVAVAWQRRGGSGNGAAAVAVARRQWHGIGAAAAEYKHRNRYKDVVYTSLIKKAKNMEHLSPELLAQIAILGPSTEERARLAHNRKCLKYYKKRMANDPDFVLTLRERARFYQQRRRSREEQERIAAGLPPLKKGRIGNQE